jgi:quercetin dioxygenase-like cupin family protein
MLHRRDVTAGLLASAGMAICAIAATAVLGEPAAPRVVAEARFTVTNPAAQAELVQLVVDFPPGAWTSLHTHGGQAINLVLEGEITLRQAGIDRLHRAGQAWSDSTGDLHAAGNTGPGKARLLTNFLLPRGAPQTTAERESHLEPTIVHEARFPLPALPAEAEIVPQVVDVPSGWREERTFNGLVAVTVVDGEVAYGIGPERRSYRAGEAWSAQAGTVVAEDNRSGKTARVFTTHVLPRGAAP